MSIVALLPLAMAAAFGAETAPLARNPQPLLIMAQARADDPTPELAGTEWLLKSIGDMQVDPKIGSSLEFDDGGNAFGSGGCNRFRGPAEIDGTTLTFGDLASTMMACEEPNSKQEAAFHEVLSETVAFKFEEGDLLLIDSEDETVAKLSPAK